MSDGDFNFGPKHCMTIQYNRTDPENSPSERLATSESQGREGWQIPNT